MIIRESAEDYLEAVLIINERKGFTKSIDIANELKVTKPSVSVAMKNLKESGYLSIDAKGIITLLPAGLEIAEKTYARHTFLRDAFIYMGVDKDTATADACRMEHVLSDETFDALKKHIANVSHQEK